MSRFYKLSQTLWHCQYHIIWCPKYRFRVLEGRVKEEVEDCIRTFTAVQKCELVELNIQIDHVHMLILVPPKISISTFMGTVKGCTAIRVLNKFRKLKKKMPFWGNHFYPLLGVIGKPGPLGSVFYSQRSAQSLRNSQKY